MKKTRLGLLLVLALASILGYAQTADDITTERHHALLLQDSKVRVFSVTLRPTDRAFVRHEHNYATITLNDCELVIWKEGQSDILNFRLDAADIRFIFGGVASGLRNDRSQECRMVMVEFLNPKVTTYGYQPSVGGWDYGANAIPPPVDPQKQYENTLSLQMGRLERVQLLPGDDLPAPSEKVDEYLVPLTDVDLKAGTTPIRKSVGEAIALPGRTSKLVNRGKDPAKFALIELH